MPYLIDRDVLIDVSRSKPAAREYIDALPEGWDNYLPLEFRMFALQSWLRIAPNVVGRANRRSRRLARA